MKPNCIVRKLWEATRLVSEYQPRFHHSNKQFLYDLAFPKDSPVTGEVCYSQWCSRPLPPKLQSSTTKISYKDGFFDYAADDASGLTEWHMNFANDDLFSSWSTSLFAQDELQVAEHPILIFVRLAMSKEGIPMRCVTDGAPTPALITGVERRLSVDTAPNVMEGRPVGLYGNYFKRATESQILQATKVVRPPSITNILAIEAPSYGSGVYTAAAILYVINTAYAGFSAVRDESLLNVSSEGAVMHSGYWGCGAYGGNRVLMLLLQMVAAQLAGLQEIVFHVGDESGRHPYKDALDIYNNSIRNSGLTINEAVEVITSLRFEWGESDGN
jgi:hypothetical protein